MAVVVNRRSDFSLDNFQRVAFEGEGIEIGPTARAAMTAARRGFLALLDSDRSAFIYGTTTRPGIEASTPVPPEQQREFARSFRAVSGLGFSRGCHDEQIVRGMVFARLADFVEGHAKVRPEVADQVAALLGSAMPCVPLDGQAGPGEVLPMLHLIPALEGLDLEEGEGMALINGSPYSTAILADTAVRAKRRLAHAELVFALAIDAFRAPLDAYDEALEDLWGDRHQAAALRSLRAHLAGADLSGRLTHQAPVSFRIVPRLAGEARRAVEQTEQAAGTALRSVSVNPVYLPPDPRHPLGRVASNGGFHNATASPVLQGLSSAWAELALAAERQVACFHRGADYGLPHLLRAPGHRGSLSGATNLFGWSVAGYVESARAAAAPALMPTVVADSQNDLSTATSLAHDKQRRAADGLDGALAILALVASQALFVTGREPAPALAELVDGLRSVFPPVDGPGGRDLGEQAGRLAEVFHAGAVDGRLEFLSPHVSLTRPSLTRPQETKSTRGKQDVMGGGGSATMITKAAVLPAVGEPLVETEVDLAAPGADEVRVRIEASGVCHSDWNAATGASATALPAVLGHEGSGVVEEVGAAVTALSPGDTVVLSFLPACGTCRACQRGRPSLCEVATRDMAAGSLPGGGFRLSHGGRRLHHYSYLSTFARHAVVNERCCIRLPAGTDTDVAALVGCAVTTGIGAVINRARIEPGCSVAVFGAGGVGLSAIMGARLAGAETIIAVEPSGSRRALALELGATLALDGQDPAVGDAVLEYSHGGVDYAFEAAGLPPLLELGFSVTRPGGMIVAIGVPPDGSVVSLPGPQLVRSEKVVTGTFYGSARPAIDMPMILRLHAQGRLPLEKLVGRRYRLAEVNEAFADMRSGVSARGVLRPWEEATGTDG